VDANENLGENGYQRHIKHQYIRNFVVSSPGRYLFDYDDILCWSDAGERREITWTDYAGVTQTFQAIHADNMLDMDGTYTEDGDHIGQRGALRLAKAFWWMLARMAGWDGETLGVNETDKPCRVTIQPNPVSDYLAVRLDDSVRNGSLVLTDMNGREILNRPLAETGNGIDMRGFSDGMYIVKLIFDDTMQLHKIVKN
jgi:hypothetical protein